MVPEGNTAPVGNRLRYWRVHRILTQAKLAKKARVDKSSISYVERGLREPSDLLKMKLSKALDVPVDDLFPPGREKVAV